MAVTNRTRKPIKPPTPESQALATQHLGLVRPFARKYCIRTGLEYDDLEAAGYVGLVKASRVFDPSRGLKFSTIAVTYICGTIRQHIRDHGYTVKFPRAWREQASSVRNLAKDKTITTQQIAEQSGLSHFDVQEILAAMHHPGALPEDGFYDANPHEDPEPIDSAVQAACVIAADAFTRLSQPDQHLVLGMLATSRRRVQQSLTRFRKLCHRIIPAGRSMPAAAEQVLYQRRADGLRPFRGNGRMVGGTEPCPEALQQRLKAKAEQLGIWQPPGAADADPAVSTDPAATPAPVDPASPSLPAESPGSAVPSAAPRSTAGTGSRRHGRGRRSSPATSRLTQSQAVTSSSQACAEASPILPDPDPDLDHDRARSGQATVAPVASGSSGAVQHVSA